MDRITLTGVTAVGHHGVFDFERREGQPFVVDAVLYLDFAPAAASDDVRDTAHYGEVAQRITEWISGEPLNLIEALAVRIADSLLAEFRLQAVDITVHKPQAPIEVPFGDVAVTVHRGVNREKPGHREQPVHREQPGWRERPVHGERPVDGDTA
jgi:dihydroneopterin aldolase